MYFKYRIQPLFLLSSGDRISAQLSPDSAHKIYPVEFIEPYLQFVINQMRQMHSRGMIAQGLRGFSAELLVEFTYTIYAPDIGLHESLTYGYRIPLTNEVFTFSETGMRAFDWESDTNDAPVLTLPIIAAFIAAICLSAFGLRRSFLQMSEDPNEHKRKANAVLKKYADVIVISEVQPELTGYTCLPVTEFEELFKLAINLNKHIICCCSEDCAAFAIIVDNHAYSYTIVYHTNDTDDTNDAGPKLEPEEITLV